MNMFEHPPLTRGRAAPSARGERRNWKVPGMSDWRIGGSVGRAAEAVKKKLPSVPSMIGSNMFPGGNIVGSALNGSTKEDFVKGVSNLPFVYGATKLLPQGGVSGVPGSPGSNPGGGPGPGMPNVDPATMEKVREYLSGSGLDMSTIEKVLLVLNGVSGVAEGVGSFLEGKNYNDRMKEQLAENQRQFNVSNELNQKQFAEGQRQFNVPEAEKLSRSQDVAPLRDRAAYMLSARLGESPTAYQGASLSSPGQQGGINQNVMKGFNDMYQPWMGGTKPGVDIRQNILRSLGYGG